MRRTLRLCLALTLSCFTTASAQFAYGIGGSGAESETEIAPGPAGSVYVSSTVASGTISVDDANGSATATFTGSQGSLVVRYSSAGVREMVLPLSSSGSLNIVDLEADNVGGFYVLGSFSGTVNMDPLGSGSFNETSSNGGANTDLFWAWYTSTGQLRQVTRVPGLIFPTAIAFTTAGAVVVGGEFYGTVDFDPGPSTTNLVDPAFGGSGFVALYNNAGGLVRAGALVSQSSGQVTVLDIDVDTSVLPNVFHVGGRFTGNTDFDIGAGSAVVGGGSSDGFVARYGFNLGLLGVATISGAGSQKAVNSVAHDGAGGTYAGGGFIGTADFGGSVLLTAQGTSDGYLVHYDNTSTILSAEQIGGTATGPIEDTVYNVYRDAAGNVYASGSFRGTVDFDFGPGTVQRTSSSAISHFAAKYSSSGVLLSVTTKGNNMGLSEARGAIENTAGGAFIVGRFQGAPTFKSSSSTTIPNRGNFDLFVLSTDPSGALPAELTAFDAISEGADVLLSWATASETDNAGFAVELNLDVAGERGASSEWTEVGFVEGAGTVKSPRAYGFRVADLPAGTHRFRLKQVDFDGAFEYSPIVEATVVPTDASLAVYPQPAVGSATVVVELPRRQQVEVQVYDLLGRLVETLHAGEAGPAMRFQTRGSLPAGVYVVRLDGETGSVSQRMVLMR
ncbi:MAG: T9SS type A sorting domain-containing protein [Bacteroidota bacterium]